jgi:hypothetical protein
MKYIDQCLADHFENDVELTPSFQRSLRALQQSTELKIVKSNLILEREKARILAIDEEKRRKESSGAWVQQGGVLTKGMGVDQIKQKKEDFQVLQDGAKKMKMIRTINTADNTWKGIVGKMSRFRKARGVTKDPDFTGIQPKSKLLSQYDEILLEINKRRENWDLLSEMRRKSHGISLEQRRRYLGYSSGYKPSFYIDISGDLIRIEEDGSELIVCA